MPSVGRIIHVRDESGRCIPAIVTRVWDKERPDYIQATAFLDLVNDYPKPDPVNPNGRPRGLWGCSSITPSSITCGAEVLCKEESNIKSGIVQVTDPPSRPDDTNYAAWEFPWQKWHWPGKSDN